MENYYERKFEESYKYIEWSVFKKAIKKKRAKGALFKMLHGVTPIASHNQIGWDPIGIKSYMQNIRTWHSIHVVAYTSTK